MLVPVPSGNDYQTNIADIVGNAPEMFVEIPLERSKIMGVLLDCTDLNIRFLESSSTPVSN